MNKTEATRVVAMIGEIFPASFSDRAGDRWTDTICRQFIDDLKPLEITFEQVEAAMYARRRAGDRRCDVSEAIEVCRGLDTKERRRRYLSGSETPMARIRDLPPEEFEAAWWAAYRQALKGYREDIGHPVNLCFPCASLMRVERKHLDKPDAQIAYWAGWIVDHLDGILERRDDLLEDRARRMRPSAPESRAAIRAEYSDKARAKATEGGL